MKKILPAAVFAACILIITAPLFRRDSRPLHEKIADYMFHAEFDPRWEHLTERYGEDDFTVGEAGGIYSERFGTWVNLFWNAEEKTYQDNYVVYLRRDELIALLDDAFGDVLGSDAYRIYVLPYTFYLPSFDQNTEALKLLEISALTDTIPVQAAVFTAKVPAGRDADWQEIQEAVQSRGGGASYLHDVCPEGKPCPYSGKCKRQSIRRSDGAPVRFLLLQGECQHQAGQLRLAL